MYMCERAFASAAGHAIAHRSDSLSITTLDTRDATSLPCAHLVLYAGFASLTFVHPVIFPRPPMFASLVHLQVLFLYLPQQKDTFRGRRCAEASNCCRQTYLRAAACLAHT